MKAVSTYYISDSAYPEKLKPLADMPKKLYVKGNLPDPDRPAVAIVGARNCSVYGRNQAARYARILAEHGVQIISGLAFGIDTEAHKGCMLGGMPTFAVLGCGVDICYPKENFRVYEQILESGGGILSEYEEGSEPLGWHFPRRNRIISALADAVLLVEAREKSGSLITADLALEQGKNIYAIPGRVTDPNSLGCNRLISQGAGIAWCPELILNELGLGDYPLPGEEGRKPSVSPSRLPGLSGLLNYLTEEPKSLGLLVEECRRPAGEVSRDLLLLVLDGQVLEMPPGFYSRKSV